MTALRYGRSFTSSNFAISSGESKVGSLVSNSSNSLLYLLSDRADGGDYTSGFRQSKSRICVRELLVVSEPSIRQLQESVLTSDELC